MALGTCCITQYPTSLSLWDPPPHTHTNPAVPNAQNPTVLHLRPPPDAPVHVLSGRRELYLKSFPRPLKPSAPLEENLKLVSCALKPRAPLDRAGCSPRPSSLNCLRHAPKMQALRSPTSGAAKTLIQFPRSPLKTRAGRRPLFCPRMKHPLPPSAAPRNAPVFCGKGWMTYTRPLTCRRPLHSLSPCPGRMALWTPGTRGIRCLSSRSRRHKSSPRSRP